MFQTDAFQLNVVQPLNTASGGGSNTTITPLQGSLVVNFSVAPTVTLTSAGSNTTITPLQGSITCTGFAPVAHQDLFEFPVQGTVTLLGVAPGVVQAFNITPLVGAVTINGPNAVVTSQNIDVLPTGAVALTGIAPVVVLPINTVIPQGGATLTGFAPVLRTATSITPAAGSLVLGAAGDPYWNNVVLAMHMDGTNGGTAFTDVKGHSVSVGGGTVTTDTATVKFGTASAKFVAVSSSYLTTPTSSDWELGDTYTVECWVNPNTVAGNQGIICRGYYQTTGAVYWVDLTFMIRLLANTVRAYFWGVGSSEQVITGGTLTAGLWVHLAMVRNGTNGNLFVNGVSVGTITGLTSTSANTRALKIGLMDIDVGGNYLDGYVDDVLITKGVAKYASNFTPATTAFLESTGGGIAPVLAFANKGTPLVGAVALTGFAPTVSRSSGAVITPGQGSLSVGPLDKYADYVVMRMALDGANAAPVYTDDTGNVSWRSPGSGAAGYLSTTLAQFGSASLGQDGFSRASAPSSLLDTAGIDFTLEGWAYHPASAGSRYVFKLAVGSEWIIVGSHTTNDFEIWRVNAGPVWNLVAGSGTIPAPAAWHYYAVSVTSGVVSFYIDGVLQGATGDATSSTVGFAGMTGGSVLTLGPSTAGCYTDDVRFTKGIGRYSGATIPVPSVANPPAENPIVVIATVAPSAALSLQGFAPTVVVPVNTVITPTRGTLTLSSVASSVRTGKQITPSTGLLNTEADTTFALTVLQVHFDGANLAAASTLSDDTGRHSGLFQGGQTLDTGTYAPPRIGSASLYNGYLGTSATNGSAYLMDNTDTRMSDFYFGNADFTVEFFVRPHTNGTAYDFLGSSGGTPFRIWRNASNQVVLSSGGATLLTTASTLSSGTWYHLALVGASGTYKIYIDGTPDANSYTGSPNFTGSNMFIVGAVAISTYCSIDELRVTKGLARYTSAFTPQLTAFTASTNPQLTQTTLGNTTITPVVGAVTLAGAAPQVSVALRVTPQVGAVALTGYASTLTYAYTITPALGAIGLVGTTPLLGRSITFTQGTVSLTGFAPTASRNSLCVPSTGVLNVNVGDTTRFDIYSSNTILAMHMDGVQNSTTSFVDLKGHSITNQGGAYIDTTRGGSNGAAGRFNINAVTIDTSLDDFRFGTSNFCIEFWFNTSNSQDGAFSTVFQKRESSSIYCGVAIGLVGDKGGDTGNAVRALATTADGTWDVDIQSSGFVPYGTWAHAAVERNGSYLYIYVNGVAAAVGAIGTGALFDQATNDRVWIGGDNGETLLLADVFLDDLRVTKGAVRYPSGSLVPPPRPFPDGLTSSYPPLLATGVTTAQGTVSLTGFAPQISQSVMPATGSITFAGTTASLNGALTLVPGTGALALTGTNGTTATTTKPVQGTVTLAGFAPTVSVTTSSNTTIIPTQGSVTLTGYAPTLTAANIDTPVQGSATLTGFAPVLSAARVASPTQGSLALTGYAPTLTTRVTLSTGAVALTGTAPVLSVAKTITPTVGAVALTGFAPTIQRSGGSIVGAGTVVLTGSVPTLRQSLSVTPQSGVLGLIGAVPTSPVRGSTERPSQRIYVLEEPQDIVVLTISGATFVLVKIPDIFVSET